MRIPNFLPRLIGKRLRLFSEDKSKSIYDPRAHDEVVRAVNLLLDLRVVVRDSGESVLQLTDNRATLIVVVPPPNPVIISEWLVQEVRDEYLVCVSWNGTVAGTKQTKVAKPNTLRSSLTVETLPDGTIMGYSAFDVVLQTRHANGDDGTDEDQAITPRYMTADVDNEINIKHVVYAVTAKTFAVDEDGKKIGLMDLNPQGRAYAAPQ